MNKFDILFYDTAAYKHYDQQVLETQGMGGTEATIVRVAEELGRCGFKVGVMNHKTPDITMGLYAYYLPITFECSTSVLVSIRGISGFDRFKNAKKFSWHHDMPNELLTKMQKTLVDNNYTVICVSEFHKTNFVETLKTSPELGIPRVIRIYNPVDKSIDVPRDIKMRYDKNSMVWCASPHKGLTKAVEQFKLLRAFLPKIELKVFNPGYFKAEIPQADGVIYYGSASPKVLWQEISQSLCVFYPTEFLETFGLIAAEANALHCPVATMRVGALNETVQTNDQLVPKNDYKGLLKKVETWYNDPRSRPDTTIQPRFRIEEVGKQWIQLLTRN